MSLLENIIASKSKINFDLSKSLNENIYLNRDANPNVNLPVVAEKSSWETVSDYQETYMKKAYKFNLGKHLTYFITTVLERADKIQHHPIILINEDIVEIKLFTKDVNDITELDIELSKFIDEIHAEINYILEF